MKMKSIKDLFAELDEKSAGGKDEGTGPKATEEDAEVKTEPLGEMRADSAAERVGRALLERLGADGMDEDELADAIIAVWENEGAAPLVYAEPDTEPEAPAKPPLVAERRRMPQPMRADAAAPAPLDYDRLTAEQFRRLKKQLQKAAADGRKVRL